jgi:hypothetical protein
MDGDGNRPLLVLILTRSPSSLHSKRQYVFQLSKWGVKKYKNASADAKPSGGSRQPPNEHADAAADPAADADNIEDLSPLVPGMSKNDGEGHAELLVLKADFYSAVSDDDRASTLYVDLERQIPTVPRLTKERLLMSRARAAETTENAEHVIRSIESALGSLDGDIDMSGEALFTKALYQILLGYVHDRSNMDREDAGGNNKAVLFVTGGMKLLVVGETSNLRDRPAHFKVFDMVTYMLLHYGLETYTNNHRPDGDEKPLPEHFTYKILREFVDQQGLRNAVLQKQNSRPTILRACLAWCITKLEVTQSAPPSAHLSELLQVECPDYFVPWKADIFVYCFLWRCWYDEYVEGNLPPWSRDAMVQLGISFSDLLVTLVWMFMHPDQDPSRKNQGGREAALEKVEKSRSGSSDDPAEQKLESTGLGEGKPTETEATVPVKHHSPPALVPPPDSKFIQAARRPESLVTLAKERARMLSELTENNLWAQALDEFTWLNSHADLPKEEKKFNETVFKQTHKFIEELVKVYPKRTGQSQTHERPFANGAGKGSDNGDDDDGELEEDYEDSGDDMDIDDDMVIRHADGHEIELD